MRFEVVGEVVAKVVFVLALVGGFPAVKNLTDLFAYPFNLFGLLPLGPAPLRLLGPVVYPPGPDEDTGEASTD